MFPRPVQSVRHEEVYHFGANSWKFHLLRFQVRSMLQADSEDSDFETVCRVLFARSKKPDDPALAAQDVSNLAQ